MVFHRTARAVLEGLEAAEICCSAATLS